MQQFRRRSYTSALGGDVVKNHDPARIVEYWERKAYDAERAGENIMAQMYFQQAENYKPTKFYNSFQGGNYEVDRTGTIETA